jgi:hypothetical protein
MANVAEKAADVNRAATNDLLATWSASFGDEQATSHPVSAIDCERYRRALFARPYAQRVELSLSNRGHDNRRHGHS